MSDRPFKRRLSKTIGKTYEFAPNTKEKDQWLQDQTVAQQKTLNYLLNDIVDYYMENYSPIE